MRKICPDPRVHLFGYGICVKSSLNSRDVTVAVVFRRPIILMLVAFQLILLSLSDQSSFEPHCFVSWTSAALAFDFTPMATMGKNVGSVLWAPEQNLLATLKQDL